MSVSDFFSFKAFLKILHCGKVDFEIFQMRCCVYGFHSDDLFLLTIQHLTSNFIKHSYPWKFFKKLFLTMPNVLLLITNRLNDASYVSSILTRRTYRTCYASPLDTRLLVYSWMTVGILSSCDTQPVACFC